MAKYIVTGAAGFIASRVAELLLSDGHTVIGVDNLNDAYDIRMKEFRLRQLESQPGFSFHKMDIADRERVFSLANQAEGANAVINLAARAGVRASVQDPWVYVDTNMTGTLNLLELCRQMEIPKLILASTSSVYGENVPLPTPEEASSNLPLQPYAASKLGAEAMAHAFHYLHGIDISVVRYFTVYGPAGRPDMVMFRFAKWLIDGVPLHLNGDGSQSRGFTYVDDIAKGTIQALRPLGYQIINLGGHETITIRELIALMENITGKQAEIIQHPFPKADMLTNHADTQKAMELLNWRPEIGLEEGVRRTVQWYLDHYSWAKDLNVGL